MSHYAEDEWRQQPADPNLAEDLEYELVDWTTISASQQGRDYLMFIPEEEEMLREDEFIVAQADDVVDLIETV